MNRCFGFRLAVGLGLAALLLMSAAPRTEAQTAPRTAPRTEARPAAVLGLMRPSAGSDGELGQVLTSSIAVKLTRWGLQAITEPAVVAADTPMSAETLFTIARRVEADYVLEGVYSNSRDEIEIRLVWYDVTTREACVSVSERGKLGLSLDRLLSEALAEILAGVEGELARYPQISESFQALPAAGRPGGLPGPAAPAPAEAAPRLRPERGPGEAPEPHQPVVVLGKPRRKHVELATSGSAFIATGEASEYFKIGYGSALCLDLLIPAGAGRFGVGLYGGVNYFEASGVATSARSLLVPMGLDLRYTLDEALPLGLFVHVSGGPAMLMLRSDYWGELTKLVPYALAGLGLNLNFARFMGTALDLSYSLYFEGSLLITAFSPSVSLYFRF